MTLKKIKKYLLLVPSALDIGLLIGYAICTVLLTIKANHPNALMAVNEDALRLTAILLLSPVAIIFVTFHLLSCFGLIPIARNTEIALFATHILLATSTAVCMIYQRFLWIATITSLGTIVAVGMQFCGFYDYYWRI